MPSRRPRHIFSDRIRARVPRQPGSGQLASLFLGRKWCFQDQKCQFFTEFFSVIFMTKKLKLAETCYFRVFSRVFTTFHIVRPQPPPVHWASKPPESSHSSHTEAKERLNNDKMTHTDVSKVVQLVFRVIPVEREASSHCFVGEWRCLGLPARFWCDFGDQKCENEVEKMHFFHFAK